jgi:thioredoxin reductase
VSSVLVVGGGPAGLAAAVELRRLGIPRVVVIEREAEAGGVPRHCDHTGFGVRDLHRLATGPGYARRWVDLASRTGVEIRTSATATGWADATALSITSPAGVETLAADAVLLATGCRERPRSARLVPGARPLGVFTTGALQQLVHLHHARVGRRAVVIGAEHISFSAALTLREAGCETVAIVTEHPAHQTWAPLAWLAAGRRGIPILTRTTITTIAGARRVEAVELQDLATGERRRIACDTVVFSGDLIPDHELARRRGLATDARSGAPRGDQVGRTLVRGVFVAGSLVHPAEPADVVALGGRATARAIAHFLATGAWSSTPLEITGEAPVRSVWPSLLDPAAPHPRLLLHVDEMQRGATIVVTQGERTLWTGTRRRLIPHRSAALPAAWLRTVDPLGGPVRVGLRATRPWT